MLNLMKSKSELNVINDQVGSPTYAADLAEVILLIINTKIWKPGVYHYTNLGKVSWFDFAKEIKCICGFNVTITPITSRKIFSKSKTSKIFNILDNSKIINTFNINQIELFG